MERLFSPCTRYRYIAESQGFRDHPEDLQELNLDVSTEAFLSAKRAFTYANLYAMLGNRNTVLWLTPHAAVARTGGRWVNFWGDFVDDSFRYCFTVDGGEEIIVNAFSPEHQLEICDVVVRLLAASAVHSVVLRKWGSRGGALINAARLVYLMEQCQRLKVLKLQNLESLDENHCHALEAYSRPGVSKSS
jgi:hypothetical protein